MTECTNEGCNKPHLARGWCSAHYNEHYQYSQWVRRIVSIIKYRAKKRGIPFDLTIDDVEVPKICPILKVPLVKAKPGTNRNYPNSPSIDRINPEKGYVKGNIQVISMRANVMKNDASPDELLLFAQWVLETYGDEIS